MSQVTYKLEPTQPANESNTQSQTTLEQKSRGGAGGSEIQRRAGFNHVPPLIFGTVVCVVAHAIEKQYPVLVIW